MVLDEIFLFSVTWIQERQLRTRYFKSIVIRDAFYKRVKEKGYTVDGMEHIRHESIIESIEGIEDEF